MFHPLGTRVDVVFPDRGLGTIMHIMGGPDGPQYRVLLDQPTDQGLPDEVVVRDEDVDLATPISVPSVGDRVRYLGRGAIVTDVGADGRLYILCDRDPPELFSGVEHEYIFILYPWQIHADNRTR